MNTQDFDYSKFKQDAADRLKKGGTLFGPEGVLTPLIKEFLEEALEGELDAHLDETRSNGNRKNGKSNKKVLLPGGEVDVDTPRDRQSSFEPEILPKRQKSLGLELDKQIVALYARGASYSDIQSHLQEMYGLDVSVGTLSRVTDKILPLIQEWRSRPLEQIYPFVWLDAINYKVRYENRVENRAVHCILGINQDGYKELLGMYATQNESAKFWLQVLTDLQNRGVKDMLIVCTDNLAGFQEAIESVYPQAQIQLCVVHQIRNSCKYVANKYLKDFMKDLKPVYQAPTIAAAETALDHLEATWGNQYPKVIESWRRNWLQLSYYFQYTKDIRKVMYTTNIIEGFHRQLRKVTKTKGAFSNEDALMKLLFLVQDRVCSKWNRPIHNWNLILSQLSIAFSDRIALKI